MLGGIRLIPTYTAFAQKYAVIWFVAEIANESINSHKNPLIQIKKYEVLIIDLLSCKKTNTPKNKNNSATTK
jgi:hypothetical protein